MQNKKKLLAIFIPIAVFALGTVYLAKAAAVVYPVSTLANNGDVLVQTQAIKFESGKWTYHFGWDRVSPYKGKVTIAPVTNENLPVITEDPASEARALADPLIVQLNPATRYVFKYYAEPGSSCDQNAGEGDLACKPLPGGIVYFNTRDENGNIMSISNIPASRGGTMPGTTADQPLAVSTGTLSSANVMIRSICDILLLLVAKLPAGTDTNALIAAVNGICTIPSTSSQNNNTVVIGGQTDIHGCYGSAGYSWCAVKNKCLRTWEEPCTGTTPAASGSLSSMLNQARTVLDNSDITITATPISFTPGTGAWNASQSTLASTGKWKYKISCHRKTDAVWMLTVPIPNQMQTYSAGCNASDSVAYAGSAYNTGVQCRWAAPEIPGGDMGKENIRGRLPVDGEWTLELDAGKDYTIETRGSWETTTPVTLNGIVIQSSVAKPGGKKVLATASLTSSASSVPELPPGDVAACQAEVAKYKTFAPNAGASPHFSVSSSLAQQMKTWERCHYGTNYGAFVDANYKGAFIDSNGNIGSSEPIGDTIPAGLKEHRAQAQACIRLAQTQGAQLGFDEVRCSYGEYCGLGDGVPDSLCTSGQRWMGSSASCTLREGNVELFAGEAADIVGNDYGAGSIDSRYQNWFAWFNSFNKEIAKKELSYSPWEVWYDAGKNLYRGPNKSGEYLTKMPAVCNGIVKVNAVTSGRTSATVSWEAPSSVTSVSIYLLSPGRVAGHLNDLSIESTVAQNIQSRAGTNTYTFSIPLETTLPVPGSENSASWLYGLSFGSNMDSAVSSSVLSTGYYQGGSDGEDHRFMFVRVVANNGLFGDSNGIGLNGQNGTPDYGTVSVAPPMYLPGLSRSCEQQLPANITVGNANCYSTGPQPLLTTDALQVGVYGTSHFGPGMFDNGGIILRVAEVIGNTEIDSRVAETAVRTGCPGNTCVLKVDNIWRNPGIYGPSETNLIGNYPVENLKPGTKYWFRTAAVCNVGQSNQVVGGEEVWSCTTPGGSASCVNECISTSETRCQPGTPGGVRQKCGYYDSDSCLDWGDGSNSVTGFYQDPSCRTN